MKIKIMLLSATIVLYVLSGVGHSQTANSINGVVFADYYYNWKNSVPAEVDRNAFQIRRYYFTYENNLTPNVKIRFRLDSEHDKYGSATKLVPFIKHAFLEWRELIPKHALYLGIAETNAFKNSEELWGYRSVEKTIMDMNKLSSSADMGIGLKGDFNGFIHHWLTVMNGTGYSTPEGDRYKKIGYALWLTPVKGFILEGYVDYEKQNPKDLQTANANSTARDYALGSSYLNWKLFIGVDRPSFSVGAEYFNRINRESGIRDATITADNTLGDYSKADVRKSGYSFFGSFITPIPKVKVFARYDFYDPNTDENVYTSFKDGKLSGSGKDNEYGLIIAGVDFIPYGGVHFMPNVLIKRYAAEGAKNDVTVRMTMYIKYDSGKIVGQ